MKGLAGDCVWHLDLSLVIQLFFLTVCKLHTHTQEEEEKTLENSRTMEKADRIPNDTIPNKCKTSGNRIGSLFKFFQAKFSSA